MESNINLNTKLKRREQLKSALLQHICKTCEQPLLEKKTFQVSQWTRISHFYFKTLIYIRT